MSAVFLICFVHFKSKYVLVSQTISPFISSADGYFALVNTLIYSQEQQSHAGCPTVPPQGPFGALLLFNVATAVCVASIFQTPLTQRSYWYHVAGGIYGVECKCRAPLFYCANSLSNIHYLKSLLLFHQSRKYPNFLAHKKHIRGPMGAPKDRGEKKKESNTNNTEAELSN